MLSAATLPAAPKPGAVGDLKQILIGGRGAEHIVAEADAAAVVADDVVLRRLAGVRTRHHLPGDRIDGEIRVGRKRIQQGGGETPGHRRRQGLLQNNLGRRRLGRVGVREPAERRLSERIAENVIGFAIAAVGASAGDRQHGIGSGRRRGADGEDFGKSLSLRRGQQVAADDGSGEVARPGQRLARAPNQMGDRRRRAVGQEDRIDGLVVRPRSGARSGAGSLRAGRSGSAAPGPR